MKGTHPPDQDGVYLLADGRFARFWLGQWRKPHTTSEAALSEERLDAFPSPQFRIAQHHRWTSAP